MTTFVYLSAIYVNKVILYDLKNWLVLHTGITHLSIICHYMMINNKNWSSVWHLSVRVYYLSHIGNGKNHSVMTIVMWICVHPYKATHFEDLKSILHFIAFMVLHTDYYRIDRIDHRMSIAWFLVWMLAYRSWKIVLTLIQRRQRNHSGNTRFISW